MTENARATACGAGFAERPFTPETITALYALLGETSIARQAELLARPRGIEDKLIDPALDPGLSCAATVDGEVAGFRLTFLLTGGAHPWSTIWLGVAGRFRRRGLGTWLLRRAIAGLAAHPAGPIEELCLAAYIPDAAAEGFAAHRGFGRAHAFWLMDRPLGDVPEPAWPAGVEVRIYDDSDRACRDFTDCYNDSFAHHYHFVPANPERTRAITRHENFVPDGVLLAYRGGRCVGFVRSLLLPERGEVAVLGTAEEARGIGLGRALLRASVRWLEEHHAPRVTLMVDGDNEGALRLYRQEGFAVARTRQIWSRSPLRSAAEPCRSA